MILFHIAKILILNNLHFLHDIYSFLYTILK